MQFTGSDSYTLENLHSEGFELLLNNKFFASIRFLSLLPRFEPKAIPKQLFFVESFNLVQEHPACHKDLGFSYKPILLHEEIRLQRCFC